MISSYKTGLLKSAVSDEAKIGSPHWMATRWRPVLAFTYIAILICDYIIFPAGHAALAAAGYIPYTEWHPLTAQAGGIFHMAMAGILGVAAWGHTRERVAILGAAMDGGTFPMPPPAPPTPTPPTPAPGPNTRQD